MEVHYTMSQLEILSKAYHEKVVRHNSWSGLPCGEDCGAESFIDWLKNNKDSVDMFLSVETVTEEWHANN